MKLEEKSKAIGNYVVKSIYIPVEKIHTWNTLVDLAKKSKRSISETVVMAIENYVNSKKS